MLLDFNLAKDYEEQTRGRFTDSLTGLYNYGFFRILIDREVKLSERHGGAFTLALINIDSFDRYNRRYGTLKGDQELNQIANIVLDNIRQTDLAARYEGDTLAVMLTKANTESAFDVMERIRQTIEKRFESASTISAGLASYPNHAQSVEKLFTIAKKALLRAKTRGKNQIFLFENEVSIPVDGSPKLLIVDDDPRNIKLVRERLRSHDYQVFTAPSGEEALSIVKRINIDLILLDIMMPEMDGYEVCRRIKSNEDTRLIPVIMLTALDDLDSKIRGLEAGADEFLTKFPHSIEIITRINTLTKVKALNDNLTGIENVLFSLVNAVEAKDAYTQGHTMRVSSLAQTLGQKMGLSSTEKEAIRVGGMLHDIGKIGVSADILNKAGSLDPDESELIRTHAEEGYKICAPLKKNLGEALDIIRHHHEKLDGTGYPDGLKADEISMPVRIMSAVDIYDALTTDRPYRNAMSQDKALAILAKEAQEGKLDKAVVANLSEAVIKD